MSVKIKSVIIILAAVILTACNQTMREGKIDRNALVTRHNVHVTEMDTLASLTVGNGQFAMTVDATGLQTFPEVYSNGVSLGTQSDWGWHSFPNTEGYTVEETYKPFNYYGRQINYKMQWRSGDRHEAAANYFRINPHRLHLGIVGLKLTHADGSPVKVSEIANIDQTLDLWKGVIISSFTVDGEKVEVATACDPASDAVATTIKSPLVAKGQVALLMRFPYPDGKHVSDGCDWSKPDKHQSVMQAVNGHSANILRTIDTTKYCVSVNWQPGANISQTSAHEFVLSSKGDEIDAVVQFSENEQSTNMLTDQVLSASAKQWESFWMSGGAIDLSGSTDPRAQEMERRIVLSQYLTRVQCAGIYPPQETGLTFNSWYGKFHLEMDWWHGVHFALWNRTDLLEKRLGWYLTVLNKAQLKAHQQGFEGARWQKMTDPNGDDSPSSVGEMLVWQQPHIIYFAELVYRQHPDKATLEKYSPLVFETAAFMASFAHYNEAGKCYDLGPPVVPAQECFTADSTINPPFELVYWKYALEVAMLWQTRMGIELNHKWKEVAENMAPLAMADGKYTVAQSSPDTYTNPRWLNDHPMVLGAYGLLPDVGKIDRSVMDTTFNYLIQKWNWHDTWGWDYPMLAMTAARLNKPDQAVGALLMDAPNNHYLKNGHNYKDKRLRIYLPGNGGLLTAVAMMCAGYDKNLTSSAGFPSEAEGWKVRWENLSPMP